MRRLLVRRRARIEIEAAFDWYLDRSPTAALQFADAVDAAIASIVQTPEQYPVVRGRQRRVLHSWML